MIRAVLLDLDDTLIQTNIERFFPAYLQSLASYCAPIAPPDRFTETLLTTYLEVLKTVDTIHPLVERLVPRLSERLHQDEQSLEEFLTTYYRDCYSELRPLVAPRPEGQHLVEWLHQQGFKVAVATNPAIPEAATLQRMEWGGIPAERYPFALITSLENMHFGKPQAEYFQETILHMDVVAGDAIMVGDDWENDIVGAAGIGLHTYWVHEDDRRVPDGSIPISGHGTFQKFIELMQSGWAETLTPIQPDRHTLIHRLRAFPAGIDTIRRSYSADLLECCPDEHEWSARDIICHLRDHESAEDRLRLERIVREDNPFLSANYDPWAHAEEYREFSADQALAEFAALREQTVAWLIALPPETWQRPARYAIFGPTHFEEMVRFTTEHDVTHLHQIRDAIVQAVVNECDEAHPDH